jgi:2-oxoglutarate dehydrogenase complex dehydrogenase (E1) component-like enzyme
VLVDGGCARRFRRPKEPTITSWWLQLFHVLRRQMNRPFAKPLVLATPKWLLHHRRATSALQARLRPTP